MPNGIRCSNCNNEVPFNMINAVLSDSCPFCGFEFATKGMHGLKQCYSDLVDMTVDKSLSSLDLVAVRGIVQFVFHGNFEQNREKLAEHTQIFGEIFGMNVVHEEDDSGTADPVRPSSQSERPLPGAVSKPKVTRRGSGQKSIRRIGADDGETVPLSARPVAGGYGGSILTKEAIESLPDEFRERALSVKTDEDLNALMHDVAFKGVVV